MAAPAMSYLICSMALIALILVLPIFFTMERNSVAKDIAVRELTEISDYTSNTLQNLFILANSTSSQNLNMSKELIYLPLTVEGSPYILEISSINGAASRVVAYLEDQPSVTGTSWLVPGLKASSNSLLVRNSTVVAEVSRNSTGFYARIGEGD